jgi:predicted ATP-grasp superfamily ATP-dependent carboligase
VERVRDPLTLGNVLADKAIAFARVLPPGDSRPPRGRWLLKARRSSAGMGVRDARPGEVPSAREYLQEFVPGASMSAVFMAGFQRVELLGVTQQLIGTTWLHADGFKYAGNIGPAEVSAIARSALLLCGQQLMTAAGLRGVFGVDFILHEDAPAVVEVNPRYPASVEVLEHATGNAVFECLAPHPPSPRGRGGPVIGKAIYYAPHRLAFPGTGLWDQDLTGPFEPWRVPALADIPHPGTAIEKGWPVLTILETGSSPEAVRERLQSRAAELDQLLAGPFP